MSYENKLRHEGDRNIRLEYCGSDSSNVSCCRLDDRVGRSDSVTSKRDAPTLKVFKDEKAGVDTSTDVR